jgi:hypothetical protein
VKSLFALTLAGVVAAASLAAAQPVRTIAQTDESAPSDAMLKGDPNRRVCKAVVATGSRLGKAKVCKTAAEWQAQRAEDRKALERIQGQRSAACPNGSSC